MVGWIKLHRKLLEWEWYDDTNAVRLFIHLLITVNYEPKRWHGIDIGIGQKVTSLANLSSETGLSLQQVRSCLTKLKSTGEITSQSTNNFTVITIAKWDKYQQDNKPDNIPVTNEQQTDNKRITTTKEVNKERSKEVIGAVAPRSPKGSRLSSDWSLPQEWGEWAEQYLKGEQIVFEGEKFKDYWIAQAGAKGVKLDWEATWRNWIRRKAEAA